MIVIGNDTEEDKILCEKKDSTGQTLIYIYTSYCSNGAIELNHHINARL